MKNRKLSLRVLEAGIFSIKALATGEGLLATSEHGRRRKGRNTVASQGRRLKITNEWRGTSELRIHLCSPSTLRRKTKEVIAKGTEN